MTSSKTSIKEKVPSEGLQKHETQSDSIVTASMEHPGPRAARRGTLGQFGQIGLESRTDGGTQVTESGSSGSQGDPTRDPHVEKKG